MQNWKVGNSSTINGPSFTKNCHLSLVFAAVKIHNFLSSFEEFFLGYAGVSKWSSILYSMN